MSGKERDLPKEIQLQETERDWQQGQVYELLLSNIKDSGRFVFVENQFPALLADHPNLNEILSNTEEWLIPIAWNWFTVIRKEDEEVYMNKLFSIDPSSLNEADLRNLLLMQKTVSFPSGKIVIISRHRISRSIGWEDNQFVRYEFYRDEESLKPLINYAAQSKYAAADEISNAYLAFCLASKKLTNPGKERSFEFYDELGEFAQRHGLDLHNEALNLGFRHAISEKMIKQMTDYDYISHEQLEYFFEEASYWILTTSLRAQKEVPDRLVPPHLFWSNKDLNPPIDALPALSQAFVLYLTSLPVFINSRSTITPLDIQDLIENRFYGFVQDILIASLEEKTGKKFGTENLKEAFKKAKKANTDTTEEREILINTLHFGDIPIEDIFRRIMRTYRTYPELILRNIEPASGYTSGMQTLSDIKNQIIESRGSAKSGLYIKLKHFDERLL